MSDQSNTSPNLKLIIGLGNPGAQYAQTRHNAGFWLVQRIADEYGIKLSQDKKFHGLVGRGQVAGHEVRLLLPTTFMNASGQSVCPLSQFFAIPPNQILIAHDELDLPVGRVRLKLGGGHGGHNGLRDIMPCLGADFYRLRLGIGHPGHKSLVVGYVMSAPTSDERIVLERMLDATMQELPDLVAGNIASAQQTLHGFAAE